MLLLPVDDPDDPRLEAYRAVRDRDLAGREGLFVAEGEVVVRVLLSRGRYDVASLLVAERRLATLMDALGELPSTTPVYVAPQVVMDRIVGFPIHRGVLALGRRLGDPSAEGVLDALRTQPTGLVVALEGVVNHDNVGGIFRNAAALGVDAVLLDSVSCDPLYRKAIRVSVGGALFMPYGRAPDASALVTMLEAAGFTTLALTPSSSAPDLDDVCRAGLPARVAVLCGAEGPGLSAESLARCRPVRIGMAPGFDSLNVAVASGIALATVARALRRR